MRRTDTTTWMTGISLGVLLVLGSGPAATGVEELAPQPKTELVMESEACWYECICTDGFNVITTYKESPDDCWMPSMLIVHPDGTIEDVPWDCESSGFGGCWDE